MAGPGQDGREITKVLWQRFAVLASVVITLAALIRLAADAAGVARGTQASALVSAATNFVIMMIIGIAAPHAQVGLPIAPLRRRITVVIPLALLSALFNYFMLLDEL